MKVFKQDNIYYLVASGWGVLAQGSYEDIIDEILVLKFLNS